MREVGLLRADASRHFDRLHEVEVRRMRVDPECVKDQHVEVLQKGPRRLGDDAAIGAVGEVADAETQHRKGTVHQRNRHDTLTAHIERFFADFVKFELWSAVWRVRCRFEGVGEHPPQRNQRTWRSVTRHRPLVDPVEASKIVQTHYVIRMVMREQDGVDVRDMVGHALQAKLGGAINEQIDPIAGPKNAGSRAPIAGITRAADLAPASDHRNTVRGATSQNDDLCSHRLPAR